MTVTTWINNGTIAEVVWHNIKFRISNPDVVSKWNLTAEYRMPVHVKQIFHCILFFFTPVVFVPLHCRWLLLILHDRYRRNAIMSIIYIYIYTTITYSIHARGTFTVCMLRRGGGVEAAWNEWKKNYI